MKSRITRSLLALGAAAFVLSAATSRPVQAAPAGGMPVFGSVDIGKVQSASNKKAKYDTELRALADRLDYAFKQQTASLMLSASDESELGVLLSKTSRSEADKTRISELQEKSTAAAKEYTDLQQKQSPTPADTSRMAALAGEYAANQAAAQKIGDQYQTQIKALNEKDAAEFTQSVKEAISAVARQQGLTVVFDSSLAVYTSNDITDEVVKRINK